MNDTLNLHIYVITKWFMIFEIRKHSLTYPDDALLYIAIEKKYCFSNNLSDMERVVSHVSEIKLWMEINMLKMNLFSLNLIITLIRLLEWIFMLMNNWVWNQSFTKKMQSGAIAEIQFYKNYAKTRLQRPSNSMYHMKDYKLFKRKAIYKYSLLFISSSRSMGVSSKTLW